MNVALLPRVLRRDAPKYRCTWTESGQKCGIETKRGIATTEEWEQAQKLFPDITFEQVLCTGHMERVAETLEAG